MLESAYDITSNLINQLYNAIKTIIGSFESNSISEYELIKQLQSGKHAILSDLSMNKPEELFQLHFLIFHVLYKLQNELLASNTGFLEISPLAIKVIPLSDLQTGNTHIALSNELAEYYLTTENLTETTKHDIEQLILSFWKGYHNPDQHLESLKEFNLSPPSSYKEVKIQYKRLASKHHPDKGGSTIKIQKINEAMATLSHYYKNKR